MYVPGGHLVQGSQSFTLKLPAQPRTTPSQHCPTADQRVLNQPENCMLMATKQSASPILEGMLMATEGSKAWSLPSKPMVIQPSPNPTSHHRQTSHRRPSNVSPHICKWCQQLQRVCTCSDRPSCDACHYSHAQCSFMTPNTVFPGTSLPKLQDNESQMSVDIDGRLRKFNE